MTVQVGAAGTNFVGGLSARVNARFALRASFAGAGVLSASGPNGRKSAVVRFAGASSLSAIDTIIQLQVSFLAQTFFQANTQDPLLAIVGNPKARLVLAVEIDLLPLS